MLIYDALKKDHDKVKEMIDRLVHSADADDNTRSGLIRQIRDALLPHARAEEAVLYNSLRSINETKDVVKHSYAEHLEIEGYLRSLQAMQGVGADWTKTVQKLQQALLHHIQEEEGRVFTAARQVLAEDEARMMGQAFEQMKPEVREGGFMQNTLDLIANVMPERFAAPLRSLSYPPGGESARP
ncbi:MAG: hemerythrin domain-containing protein [Bdellovibrionaceae bacterium]|nr:hemerythrin domain-containing protein [Pseudobdellovibrionaceae bacterium]